MTALNVIKNFSHHKVGVVDWKSNTNRNINSKKLRKIKFFRVSLFPTIILQMLLKSISLKHLQK